MLPIAFIGKTPCRSSFLPFGKARGLQMLRYQGLEVDDYVFTLDALPLKPSSFLNNGGH